MGWLGALGRRGGLCADTRPRSHLRLSLQRDHNHRGELDVGSDGPPTTQSVCRRVNTGWLDRRMFHGNVVEQMLWVTSWSLFPAEETARG